ncbi:hypothetical protein [Moritella viscosa]|uniref:Lipoprotein n=3 Tax=Moritella viscosa TaxID=80854 RepID=A0ABY1H8D1_9GAMM|nr:hypothetical protein [Moritella viscosa]SGY84673.1 Putative uncharacterized protein VV0828 [Moritella viscosa]SGY85827.1 Putative uncharacterized protein VV0828 [Moritella viscosa]SGY86913.1 Putative uncharacterized protein VV0828 [Moritella viscosa]SHO24651.1 Putative uncharacterized protein VV0828 [Moritella viscosa]
MQSSSMTVKLTMLSIIMSTLILSGCNNENSSATKTSTTKAELSISDFSRLAIQEAEKNMVYIVNAENMDPIGQMALQNVPSALKTSPLGRYVLAFQREENLIEIIDSGVISETHGDHVHITTEDPNLLSVQYSGIKPANYDLSNGEVSVFFDGNGASGEGAEFRILNEASIGTGDIIARQKFGFSMHGTSQILGDMLLTSFVWDQVEGNLPDSVLLMERHGNHFHPHGAVDETCPDLNSSAQIESQVFFACSDGIVAIEQSNFSSRKLNYPAEFGVDSRIKHLIGLKLANTILAITDDYQMFFLKDNELVELPWKENSDDNILGFTATEDGLIVVTSQGKMRIFDASNNFELSYSIDLWKSVPEFGEITGDDLPVQIIKDKRNGNIFVTDTINQLILEVSDSSAQQVLAHQLSYKPGKIAWLGSAQADFKH